MSATRKRSSRPRLIVHEGPTGGQIRISAKSLGALALPDSCARCFWLRLRMEQRLPFQVFPGVFSTIDVFTKRVVDARFDGRGQPPEWLADLGDTVGYREPPHHSRFRILDTEHNIVLTGMPDAILVRRDGSYVIADYKTARFTAAQDELFPLYEAQLNVYARIAEESGFHPVSGLALVYLEPTTDGEYGPGESYREYGFDMTFVAHVIQVDLDPDLIDSLLVRVRELYDMATPPTGRPGCKDCTLLAKLVSLAQAT